MDQSSNAQQNTHSSHQMDGAQLATWKERSRTAQKPCAFCGLPFIPRRWMAASRAKKGGIVLMIQPEKNWDKQDCCSQSCAKRLRNPMSSHQVRQAVSFRLKQIRHKPIKRGGNGQLLPLAQLALLHALGDGWEAELTVRTGMDKMTSGYPTCYKIDLANQSRMIGIELDGGSHMLISRREQDAKKMAFLASCGWSVYRITNARALELYSTFTSVDTLLTLLTAS
jgi:hypothetical protein